MPTVEPLSSPAREARDTLDVESELAEQDAQAEQLSLEEARANKQVWVAESGTLGARLPVNEAVSRAFAVGREGGLAERMEAARNGVSVDVALSFDEEALEALCSSIDESAGEPRLDYGIAIDQGAVSVTEGHGGKAVDRTSVARQLSEGFLGEASGKVVIVATPDEADVRIGADEATRVADEFRRPSIGAAPSPSSRPSGRWGRRIWARGCAPGWKSAGRVSPWFPTSTRPRRPRGCSGSFATRATPRRPRCRSTSTAARYGSAPARARAIPIPPMRRRRPKAPCSAVRRPAPMRLPSPSSGARLRPSTLLTRSAAREMGLVAPISSFTTEYKFRQPPRPIGATTYTRRPTC
ncbi:MAG: peptidoglycan binding domain-containing protein [Adlercreutzia equolifaciens]